MGIGIGSPGIVDTDQGIIRNAVNLDWCEMDLKASLHNRLELPLPIWVQNDANACTLGEHYFGAGQHCRDFVYFSIGSGLGAGVFANGEMIYGDRDNAADIGHLSLDPDGKLCSCGLRGCAETTISGPGLSGITVELLRTCKIPSVLDGLDQLTPNLIVNAAINRDEVARIAIEKVGSDLGKVMAACVAILNPERFVVGGGLGLAAFELLIPIARFELQRRVVRMSYESLKIVRSQLNSSAVGAACQVWQRI